jgi:peptide/nickel transport system substrate-binding protein
VIPTGIGVSSSADITSMNPLFGTSEYNAEIGDMMFAGLIWINRFQQIDFSRSLASGISISPDDTVYTVTLRPWHWSDGAMVTTADVAYTFDLIKQLGVTYPDYGIGGMPDLVKALNVISPTVFQVVLKHQVNPEWFIYNGLSQFTPFPQHAWGRDTLDQIWQGQSSPAFFNVVDGPVKPVALDIGLQIVLAPNPAYDGPKMHFQRLIFRFLDSDGAALQGLQSGDLDMVNVPMPLWNAVQHLPGTYIVTLPPSPGWNNVSVNFQNPKVAFFNDVKVRQAMEDSIDQDTIVRVVDHGLGAADYGPVPPALHAFLTPGMQRGIYPVGYDPAKARALLTADGWAPGPDGVMQKNGVRLAFVDLLSSGDAQLEQEAEVIQADLRRSGIEMKVREVDFNLLLALINQPLAWQAAEYANNATSYPTGEGFFSTGATYNNEGYSDKKMDSLIDASINQPGLQNLYAYETYASAQQPFIFFESDGIAILANDRIHGIADFIDPAGNFSPDQLYCTGPAA